VSTAFNEALAASGLSPEALARTIDAFARLQSAAGADGERPWHRWYVPGRIEVLGKHTDYAGGRSLLCAAERGFSVLAAARDDAVVTITDVGRGSTAVLESTQSVAEPGWARYPLTVLRRVRENFPETGGADIFLQSDLPSASGMSSSSAMMIAVLLPLVRLYRLDRTPRWSANIQTIEDLAAYAATIENGSGFRELRGERGVGTEGGSEDHTAILCSRAGYVTQYSFCPTRHERSIAVPADLVFVIGVSGIAARKTGNARDDYNRASQRAAQVLHEWRDETGRPDETLAAALVSAPDAAARLRARLMAKGDGERRLVDRLDHFVEESMVLIPRAGDQLAGGDLGGFGETVSRSQALAERLLGNQVPETIVLARTAREEGALAASAFGAGFGGSVWALVYERAAPAFAVRWQNAYASACPDAAGRAVFFTTRPGPPMVTA
jgi:galactokinase